MRATGTRPMGALSLGNLPLATLLAALMVPAAAAVPLYLQDGDAMALTAGTPTFEKPVGHYTTAIFVPGVSGTETAAWRYTVTTTGQIRPTETVLWLKSDAGNAQSPVGLTEASACPLYVEVGVVDGQWYYYCVAGNPVWNTPGTYRQGLTWREDLPLADVAPGDEIYVSVWSMGGSTEANPLFFVVPGTDGDTSRQSFTGLLDVVAMPATNSTAPASPAPATTSQSTPPPSSSPPPATSPSTSTSASGTTSATPEATPAPSQQPTSASKGSPAPLLSAVGAAVLGVAALRRRL